LIAQTAGKALYSIGEPRQIENTVLRLDRHTGISIFKLKMTHTINHLWLGIIMGLACLSAGLWGADKSTEAISLIPDLSQIHDLIITIDSEGVCQIQTTGTDPYLLTLPLPETFDPQKQFMLSFDYITEEAMALQVFFAPSLTETGSLQSSLSACKEWTCFSVNLTESRFFTAGVRNLRLDFGQTAGRALQIRNLFLRPPTPQEKRIAQEHAIENQAKQLLESGIRAYLKNDYPCQIHRVAVDANSIQIRGNLSADWDQVYLCQALPDQILFGPFMDPQPRSVLSPNPPILHEFRFAHTLPEQKGNFALKIPRFIRSGSIQQDRLFSRWVIGRKDTRYRGNRYQLLSHARWSDPQAALWNEPAEKPASKKGIGALGINRPLEDLDQLGISSATVNIVLNELILPANRIPSIPYQLNGKTYSFNPSYVEQLDQILREASRRNIITAAIILIKKDRAGGGPGNPAGYLAHPKCEKSAIYAMANVSQPEGIEYYQTALDFLANRYSRPDKQYGRIHHWIIHNEVDMGFQWTSAGQIGPLTYMDLYQKSMRIAYLTARKYNANAKVFISLTHYWNWTPFPERGYRPRQLLEILLDQCKAEGDFQWAIAYHPYPQSLLEPKTWLDKKANFTFETPYITPHNIEVLDAWVKREYTWFEGRTQRIVWLSEQGFNSPDYSPASLSDQAAGMAYAWKKIRPLDSIETFIYHNWVDNEQEDGLHIGLRKLPADNQEPKPIWYLYRDLETPEEEAACEFAKDLIGIDDWDQVRYTEPILETGRIGY